MYFQFPIKMLIFARGKAVGQSVADATRQKRKVRATQSIPLPNGKLSAKVESCRRKEPPSFSNESPHTELMGLHGKGEKVE